MNKNKKTFYITTPIYYPSGSLHIGHLFSTNLAWVIKNYKIKRNYDVKFLTGSDEHGQKIEKKAKELNMENKDYVDMQTNKFINLIIFFRKKIKMKFNNSGIKKVSQSIKEPHKQRVYAIYGVRFTTRTRRVLCCS